MQRKTAKKKGVAAEVCTGPRLVNDSALCPLLRDIYARMIFVYTYYVRPNKFGEKKKQKNSPEVRSRDGHVEQDIVCKKI